MIDRYSVFGYTDDDPASESLLFSTNKKERAVSWAKGNNMATAVVDFETDEVVWNYQAEI
jgi:hypothetical protein